MTEKVEEVKYTFADFRNGTDHKFDDISSEIYREYIYSNGDVIRIDFPLALNVNYSSGGHRVWDAFGVSHYVAGGWKEIRWEVKLNTPHFVK